MADEITHPGFHAMGASGPPSRRTLLVLGVGAAAGMAAPGGAFAQAGRAAGPPDKPRGQVVAALSQEPTVFNPLMPGIEVDQAVWWQLFSPLWYIDAEGNFVPDLAREVPTV